MVVRVPVLWTQANDSPVPVMLENPVPRVLGGSEMTESRQSEGYLGAETTSVLLGAEMTGIRRTGTLTTFVKSSTM